MSGPKFYILVGHIPIEVDITRWSEWFGKADRHLKQTKTEKSLISTVFLGIDHNYSSEGSPVLFETLVFDGPLDGAMWRCCTWDEALVNHDRLVTTVCNAEAEEKEKAK